MNEILCPSLLSADFAHLGDQLAEVKKSGAEWLHFDVMDGKFVPELSFGEAVLRSVRKASDLVIDAHLMIFDPLKSIDSFARAGADRITFHCEACENIGECIDRIHGNGIRAGLSVRPDTPVEAVFPYLDDLDMVLLMTVYPGFGGQAFIPESLGRLKALKAEISRRGLGTDIQVDGGIDRNTIAPARDAGANIFVSGSAVFKGSISDNVKALRSSLA